MRDAPERIWVWESYDDRDRAMGIGEWYTAEVGLDGDETEYVRADIHAALTAERDALQAKIQEMALQSLSDLGQAHGAHTAQLKAEAERDALREALDRCAFVLAVMPDIALRVGLAGTSQWDEVAGGPDIFGALDQARAALKGSTNG